jgi:hypothetical protein
LRLWQSEALTTRLDLIHISVRSHPQIIMIAQGQGMMPHGMMPQQGMMMQQQGMMPQGMMMGGGMAPQGKKISKFLSFLTSWSLFRCFYLIRLLTVVSSRHISLKKCYRRIPTCLNLSPNQDCRVQIQKSGLRHTLPTQLS